MQKSNNRTMAMPRYYIPRGLENVIGDNALIAEGVNVRNKFFQVLNKLKNVDCLEIAECHFLQFVKLGLYLEEHQRREDAAKLFEIEKTTIENVPGSNEKFRIEVKDLDETNPFLNVSDLLIAYELNTKQKTKFFFTVVKVDKGHVIVSANKKFCEMYRQLAEYNIKLQFNTYCFQCYHYALETAANNKSMSDMIKCYIFPKKIPVISSGLNCHQTWFNRDISNNPNQKQAVCNIINKSSFPAPYILYGPPGTGKTSTLVEAICQSWKLSDDYILICAPSNAACDVVTKRLLHYIPFKNVYRLYSRTEEYSRIDEEIKKCCNFKGHGKVDEIEKIDLSFKKIIITTLCTSLRLEKIKLSFSHLFIDEGGQASLTDVLLPLCALKSSRPFQIVISGDHQQLGPVISSNLAKPLIGQSILEKLMKDEPYKKDAKTGYDPRYVTKLIRNYRSSKEIIHVSNVLFYDNELITCSNKPTLNFFPVIFSAVEGQEEKSSKSTSPYNEDEVNKVLFFAKKFVGKIVEDKAIRREDIGIVTPFRLQVAKIREKLNDAGLNEVDVGTVETFQGQEKKIIIISTVRSKTFFNDGVRHIGFLSNPKRFNVALTRAKTLLVVVGNPKILQTDKCWRYFLKFCQENNSYEGVPLKCDVHFPLPDLTDRSNSKKSTDLFDKTFSLLKLDDGVLPSKNNLQNASSCTADTPSTSMINNSSKIMNTPVSVKDMSDPFCNIRSVPRTVVIVNSMKKPVSDINTVPKSVVQPASVNSAMRNHNQIPSTTSRTGALNSVRNCSLNSIQTVTKTAVTVGSERNLTNNMTNVVPKPVVLPRSINLLTRNYNSMNSAEINSRCNINAAVFNTTYNVNSTRTNYSEIHRRKPVKYENNKGCGCCVIL